MIKSYPQQWGIFELYFGAKSPRIIHWEDAVSVKLLRILRNEYLAHILIYVCIYDEEN
jgi:hypothetical protein